MTPFLSPRRTTKQVRSGARLFALEKVALEILIEKGPSAVTPKALIETYRASGGMVSKQWVSDYMGNGDSILRRLADGHFKVMSRYAEEAGQLAVLSRDLEAAARILAHHVTGAQDPWYGPGHPALCRLVAADGLPVQGPWFAFVVGAVTKTLAHFLPAQPTAHLAGPAAAALMGAWFGLLLEHREQDPHRLAYLAGAFLGVVRTALPVLP